MTFIFRKYVYLRSMFIVLISCLLYPIMVVQSYIIYTDKIHSKAWILFWIKMLRWQNGQGSQHSLWVSSAIYAYCSSINGTKQNKIRLHAAINLQRAIRIKFPDHSWLFHQRWRNSPLSRGYYGLYETTATTATGTSKNNRFDELNNNSARASRFFVHFFAFIAQLRREMTKF